MEPIFIKNFLPQPVLSLVENYCLLKYANQYSFENIDSQTNSLVGEYGDVLMESILDISTSVIEKNVNKSLFPTYSYFRIYDLGSDLKFHLDREACEYTVALCISASPSDKPYNIYIGEKDKTSNYKYLNGETNSYEPLKINHTFPMLPNDALIFKGREALHWREQCENDYYMTVFLHYVDANGEFKDYKFDKRTSLGVMKNDTKLF